MSGPGTVVPCRDEAELIRQLMSHSGYALAAMPENPTRRLGPFGDFGAQGVILDEAPDREAKILRV